MSKKYAVYIVSFGVIVGCVAGGCTTADTAPGTAAVSAGPVAFGAGSAASFPTVDTAMLPRRATISNAGMGIVAHGMTLGDTKLAARDSLRLGEVTATFMVDVQAIPVIGGQDTLYFLLFPAGSAVTDTTHVESVATLNEAVRTAEDVGPGMRLDDAVARYGGVVLEYNTNDESREYVSFASNHNDRVLFRVQLGATDDGLAGIYETHNEYNRTVKYKRNARIMMVLVRL